MNAEVSAAVGFATAAVVTAAATPLAIRVANATNFLDRPREYRKHGRPTPFLGGAAVLVGFLVAAVAVGGISGKHLLIGCAVGMWLLGTLDDRFAVPPKWRLLAEAAAAAALVSVDLGWKTSLGPVFDVALTVIWIAGVVNAFNLMDNQDGACSTVGCVSGVGIGTLAAIHGQAAIAGLAFALAGACGGFLRWNLAGPAKIFLGDGGSMTVGFMVATLSMAAVRHMNFGDANVLAATMLVGLPILDTTLVCVSRARRGVTLVTGGRDHMTHRLLRAVGSPRAVAVVLALGQTLLCALAIAGDQLGRTWLLAFTATALLTGAAVIAALDTTRWRPAGIAVGPRLRAPVVTPPQGAPSRVTQTAVSPAPVRVGVDSS